MNDDMGVMHYHFDMLAFRSRSPTNSNCESGRVPERDVPSRFNPSATPFYPATPLEVPVPCSEAPSSVSHTEVLAKQH